YVEGQRVGIQVVVKRVVTEFRVETDFDIVLTSSMAPQDPLHFFAKVALNFQNQTTNALCGVAGLVGEDLLGVGEHAARSFSASDCAQNNDSGEQTRSEEH